MKNRKLPLTQFFSRREISHRVYKVLLMRKKHNLKFNWKVFKYYFNFNFSIFFQFFLKKNLFFNFFYISPIKHDNNFFRLNLFHNKNLFLYNYINFTHSIDIDSHLIKNHITSFNNILSNLLLWYKNDSLYLNFFYLIFFFKLYNYFVK